MSLLFVCFLIVNSTPLAPKDVHPSGIVYAAPFDPPGSGDRHGSVRPTKIGTKIDERFAVAWPSGLRLGEVQNVVVQIAANEYEVLLAGLKDREIKRERFRGEPKIEVLLRGDSGLEIVSQHSDIQMVEKGKPHKEWSWSVLPKMSGNHQLILMVQGIRGEIHEDYDPEIKEYAVASNWPYLVRTGIEQKGVEWTYGAIFWVVTSLIAFALGRMTKTSKDPKPAKRDLQSPPPSGCDDGL